MIRVRRPTRVPGALRGPQVDEQLAILRDWAERAPDHAPPRVLRISDLPAVRQALSEMFVGKCAYCETVIDTTQPGGPEHFRPWHEAVDRDGTRSPRHYWWLTYEWTNLVFACRRCNRSKGPRFPVTGRRAEAVEDLEAEGALLLDPCRDDPKEHLVFLADGTVASETPRGLAAIEILALNRIDLVEARRVTAISVQAALKDVASGANDGPRHAELLLDPSLPHLALRRQLVGAATGDPATPASGPAEQRRVKTIYDDSVAVGQDYTLTDVGTAMTEAAKHRYFGSAKWIERIVLTNFRPIRELDLDLSRSTSGAGPWMVLLGENGAGKSSVLQALALTLIGGESRRRLVHQADGYVRRGTSRCTVEVYLSGSTKPLVLRVSRGSAEFEGSEAEHVLLLAYGSMRLLPRQETSPMASTHGVARVDNLFDPLLPITDPTQWLLSLNDTTFDMVSARLRRLLALDEPQRLVRDVRAGTVEVREGRARAALAELGDGYQSMLILVCDILRTVLTIWDEVEQAEGIVLIDELGAHLHPRWRMRVVGALRATLPRMQFIVSTHDPLCLRGLEDGEVIVLRRNERRQIVAITDLPPVKGLRVEQLLTSEHFGLGSTNDPEVDDLLTEYYRLRAQPRPSKQAAQRLAVVERRLMELEQLGTTERERLVLRAADDFIARRRAAGDAGAPSLDDARVREQLEAIWSAKLPGSRRR